MAYFALGVEHHGLGGGYAQDLVFAAVHGNAHTSWQVQVQLRQLCIQLGRCTHTHTHTHKRKREGVGK